MDKIKAIFSPGSKSDDQTMYGDNQGKIAGEGSHFGDSKVSHPAGASEGVHLTGGATSDDASTPIYDQFKSQGDKTNTSGSHFTGGGQSGVPEGSAPAAAATALGVDKTLDKSNRGGHEDVATVPSTAVSEPLSTTQQASSVGNTDYSGPAPVSSSTAPTTSFLTHDQPSSNLGTGAATASVPSTSSADRTATTSANPTLDQSAYSQPTNNIGAAITTGSGPATSATTSSTEPAPSSAAHTSSAVPSVVGKTADEPEHHYGRDAALGAGAGAAGLGAYEAGKSHDSTTSDANPITTATSEKPLGSLRDLIDQKTGSNTATQSTGSRETGPSASAAATSGSSTAGTTGATGSSADIPSSLPLGTIRPLIDEKTGSNAASQPSGSREAGASSTSGGAGSAADIPKSLPIGTLRPLIDEKTGSNAANQSTGSREIGAGSSSGGAGSGADIPTSLPLGTIRPLIDEKTGSDAASQSAGSREVGAGSAAAAGAATGAALGSSSGSAGTTTSGTGSTSGPLGGIRGLVDEKTGSGAGTQSTGGQPVTGTSTTATESSGPATGGHTGRDAALGAVGGAGLISSYEYLRHSGDNSTGSGISPSTTGPSTTSTGASGLSSSTAQPSTTTTSGTGVSSGPTSNLRDLVNEKTGAGATTGSSSSATQPATFQSTAPIEPVANETNKDSHLGRDAALGAGAGAVGAGAYENHKHDETKHQDKVEKQIEKHDRKLEEAREHEREKHGLEAGAGALGAGALGAAAYEHHEADAPSGDRLTRLADQRGEGYGAGAPGAAAYSQGQFVDHSNEPTSDRLGRLAEQRGEGFVAPNDGPSHSGVSAAGLQEYQHVQDRDVDEAGKKRKGGILGIFKRDKHDKDEKDHHKAEEAAAGAGVAGAGAAALHEHDKNKDASLAGTGTTTGAGGSEISDAKVYRNAFGQLRSDPTEQSVEPTLGSSGVIESGTGGFKTVDDAVPAGETTTGATGTSHRGLEAAGAGAVGAGALGYAAHEHNKHEAATTGTMPAAGTTTAPLYPTHESTASTTAPYNMAAGTTAPYSSTGSTTDTTGHSHRGAEAAGTGALGAGALGYAAHEHNKHNDPAAASSTAGPAGTTAAAGETHVHHHHLRNHHHDEDRHSYAYHPDHGQHGAAAGTEPGSSHHRGEAAAAGAAGGLGAAALAKHEHDNRASNAGVDTGLGESRGLVNEGYVHHKTEKDLEAERRNNLPVVGALMGEGRFHGKEGGAPGAVGVPPQERDQAYIESQKHAPLLHGQESEHHKQKHSGILGVFHKDDSSSAERNRLHKDPPADRKPSIVQRVLGESPAHNPTHGQGSHVYGEHASTLPDTPDTNVDHIKHDPVGMGYTGEAHLGLRDPVDPKNGS